MQLTDTAEAVLEKRYYQPGEDYVGLCHRVAQAVAQAEKEEGRKYWAKEFFGLIHGQQFLPNSPCLMNAGIKLGQLSACFVLPVPDNMEGIFEAVKHGALVNKTGGGTGYSFSSLRPMNSPVQSTAGVASGPLSFMDVFNSATEVIKQGGRRRGANMGVLRVDHPDILDFILAKKDPKRLTNFNLSVAITDAFMKAVNDGTEFDLIDPSSGENVTYVDARELFDLIVQCAHGNGEPGVLFIDAANKANATPWLGTLEATNPCGEQWLLPYESCNLGSINLGRFVDQGGCLMWDQLKKATATAVRFLDDVIDVNVYPLPDIEEMTRKTRKIGLGIMGLHDMLIQCAIPYASDEGRAMACKVMRRIHGWALDESKALAVEKGPCPALCCHEFTKTGDGVMRRNAALTSIQPTGTVSMIADCASGCEPYFAIVTRKNVMDGQSFRMVNKHFEAVARREGWYSEELMSKVEESGTVLGHDEIPKRWQEVFRCAQDIDPISHIDMQAGLQHSGVDSSISKTINLPATATIDEVKVAYRRGWEKGCKGLTVYRDGSRDGQVLTLGQTEKEAAKAVEGQIEGVGKRELAVELPAKRFKVKDQDGQSIYIIICFDELENPVEVFAKFPYDNRVDLAERSTMWATTCRLASLALRMGTPVEEVIKQLDRASGSMFDLPAQLSKILKGFLSKTANGYSPGDCPECKAGRLCFQGGCVCCDSCGFSRCS